ncbi:hypothetical protein Syun_022630 [Stephania yunnanensis]|uniref:Uncharacterized protein n=1 Tax=Stephania yunnanensis TaxID=152371 RepID=A0AAP0I3A3_9MAGN
MTSSRNIWYGDAAFDERVCSALPRLCNPDPVAPAFGGLRLLGHLSILFPLTLILVCFPTPSYNAKYDGLFTTYSKDFSKVKSEDSSCSTSWRLKRWSNWKRWNNWKRWMMYKDVIVFQIYSISSFETLYQGVTSQPQREAIQPDAQQATSSFTLQLISAASVGIKACFSVIGEIMPPKRNQQRIEEVYDRNNLNRQIGPLIDQRMVAVVEQLTARIDQLLDRHMDCILPFERTDYVGSAGRWRDSHHGSREFVRWGSEDLRRPSVIVSGLYRLSSGGVRSGFAPSRAGKRSARRESGFRPSALRGGDGSIMPVAGMQPKWSFTRETEREGTRAAIVAEAEGSKEDGFRKKEKKLKGDKKFDKGGKMSSKGGSLSAIYPGRDREMKELGIWLLGADSEDDREDGSSDNEGFIGDAPQLEKGHGTRESLDILLGKVVSYNPQADVLWLRGAKEKWLAGEVDTARAILGQAYAAITNSEEILLAAIQTESRHGNKKESDILMARHKTLFVGRKRFTNLSKLTCRRLLTSTRIQSGVKINVKHLVPYYGDTSDDDNSRANSVHPGENDEVQELACKFLIG